MTKKSAPKTATTAPGAPYTLRQLEEMLGLGRSTLSGLIAAGFVTPQRGARNEYRFSFQDVVLLRTAHQLRQARIAPRRLLRALHQLRERLPESLPLSGLRIRAIGNEVAVRRADARWEAGDGQLLIDFEVAPGSDAGAAGGTVAFFPAGATGSAAPVPTFSDWMTRAERLEDTDAAGAAQAYREAIALDPRHPDPYVNLGVLLCNAGRCDDAVAVYELGVALCPDSALLHFNHAIALEDQARLEEALQSYERCLAIEPGFADAHYNAARLHELLGHPQAALRHYSAYRRLGIDHGDKP